MYVATKNLAPRLPLDSTKDILLGINAKWSRGQIMVRTVAAGPYELPSSKKGKCPMVDRYIDRNNLQNPRC